VDANWWLDFSLAVLRAATPLIFCALGVLVCERAGILNIGVEGSMLAGALAAVLGAVLTGDPWFGVGAAIVTGLMAGLVLAGMTAYLPADQIATGIAFNLVSIGITSFVYRLLLDRGVGLMAPSLNWGPAGGWLEPITARLTVIPPLTWLAVILVVVSQVLLFSTGPGLLWRSVGESARAAHAAGLGVLRVRSAALLGGSVLGALGGAALTLGWVPTFVDNMTMGRGFIGLAAVYFGRWRPDLVLFACLLFGAGEALAFRAQAAGAGLNPYYYLMLPYVLTLAAVAVVGMAMGPRDAGKPFVRG